MSFKSTEKGMACRDARRASPHTGWEYMYTLWNTFLLDLHRGDARRASLQETGVRDIQGLMHTYW